MRAGKLRHSITIQSYTETANVYGEPIKAWSTFATVRASVEPLQGREFYATQGEQSEITVRFRIRYISGVTAAMRVVCDSRTYEMQAPPIDPNMQHRELHLMCKEIT